MQFNFDRNPNKDLLEQCNTAFNTLDPSEAVYMNHYELSSETGIGSEQWKIFLTHPEVSEWIIDEVELMKRSQYNKMIQRATQNDRSVGTAQMINALDKSLNKQATADGPVFIYTYVPLADNQMNAGVIKIEDDDIFWEDE